MHISIKNGPRAIIMMHKLNNNGMWVCVCVCVQARMALGPFLPIHFTHTDLKNKNDPRAILLCFNVGVCVYIRKNGPRAILGYRFTDTQI